MKNLSLNLKICGIIAVLVLGGSVIATLGLSKMAQIRDVLVDITDVQVKRDQMTSQILDKQREVAIYNKDIIIEKSQEGMRALEKDLAEIRTSLFKTIDDYTQIASPEGKAIVGKYREALQKWVDNNKDIREATKAGQDDLVQKLVSEKEVPLRREALRYLVELNEFTAKRLVEARETALSAYDMAQHMVIVVSLVSLVVGLSLAFVILRSVSRAINQVINNLNDSSAQVTSAAQQIASSSEELSQAATEQASSLEETSSAVEEMNSMVNKNAETAKQSTDISHVSSDSAIKGKRVVEEMIRSIEDIDAANTDIMNQTNDSNQKISEIVKVIGEIGNKTKVINEIVFQTKLLSFNASVEAARAGEHGKGFAVVAEEVGNLAQMSGNAAKEITTMLDSSIQKVEGIVHETKTRIEKLISDSKHKVETGTKVARNCGEVLDEIVRNVSQVTEMSQSISTASDEQARGISEITRAIAQLDQVTQQNAAASEETASAAEELSAQAETMRGVVQTLIRTIKGDSAGHDGMAHMTQGSAPKVSSLGSSYSSKSNSGRVIHLDERSAAKKKPQPTSSSYDSDLKIAVGGNVVPSENDPRFKEV